MQCFTLQINVACCEFTVNLKSAEIACLFEFYTLIVLYDFSGALPACIILIIGRAATAQINFFYFIFIIPVYGCGVWQVLR